MQRNNISSGSPYEAMVGYSRAVRVGMQLYVAGTTASDSEGKVHGVGDAYLQTKYVIEKIQAALKQAGSGLKDVVRTRIFVTDISLFPEVARAHREFFQEVRPVTTMVQVTALVSREMLVEIEVDALVSSD